MSKLLKLKEWLTIPETVKHLSVVLGAEVTEADVLRFALDGHLRLSIRFVNSAAGRSGKVVRSSEVEWTHANWKLDEDRYVTSLDEDLTELNGVWDLLMIGSGRMDLEQKYQDLTGGLPVTLNMEGVFVEGIDGQICQIQDFDVREYLKKRGLQDQLLSSCGLVPMNVLVRATHGSRDHLNCCCPAFRLPLDDGAFDGELVVRTAALRELEAELDEAQTKRESTRKTENLLRALVCVAIHDHGYKPESSKSTAPKEISDILDEYGHPIDQRTIREWLKEGSDLLPGLSNKG